MKYRRRPPSSWALRIRAFSRVWRWYSSSPGCSSRARRISRKCVPGNLRTCSKIRRLVPSSRASGMGSRRSDGAVEDEEDREVEEEERERGLDGIPQGGNEETGDQDRALRGEREERQADQEEGAVARPRVGGKRDGREDEGEPQDHRGQGRLDDHAAESPSREKAFRAASSPVRGLYQIPYSPVRASPAPRLTQSRPRIGGLSFEAQHETGGGDGGGLGGPGGAAAGPFLHGTRLQPAWGVHRGGHGRRLPRRL